MPLIEGADRHQLQILALEQLIEPNNPVRVIDAFVRAVDLKALGFAVRGQHREGRPAFSVETLVGLYLYGYFNRIRSSRQLAKACRRNVELWWLLNYQQPCYKVIADFRKDNAKPLKGVFRQLNRLCLDWGVFGRELIAIDGSKFRAQNSMKNNFNAAKIERHIAYIDKKLDEYFAQADELDEQETDDPQVEQALEKINERVEELMERRFGYEQLELLLERSDQKQVSTTDPDARALPLHRNIVEVGYNVQMAVDDKNNLVADYEVTNEKDDYALSEMAQGARAVLEAEQLSVLADKGYHTGEELKKCADAGITTYVSPRQANHAGKNKAYQKQQFDYDAQRDEYTCPQGQKLKTKGRWYAKNTGKGRRVYRIRRYQLPYKICSACPVKDRCVAPGVLSQRQGRAIERSEYENYIVANAQRVKAKWELYRRRQAIVEHPFGTIKRAWGYTYTLLRGKEKVSGEFALIFTCYNLRRTMSILGVQGLLRRLEALFLSVFRLWATVALLTSKQISRRQGL